jgi:carbon monoxide dehydrogenase subunit G
MPEVTHSTVLNLPPETIWAFVSDMNNWAPFMTGYQKHEVVDDRHSVWTLKGDVGILSRSVDLRVQIVEWSGPERVRFTLEGLNEAVEGDGTFEMTPYREEGAAGSATAPEAAETEPVRPVVRRGPLRRLLFWIFARLFRKMHGTVDRQQLAAEEIRAGASRLTFRIRMDAGGPMGPVVNAMLEPALLPAAQELGEKIASHLESIHGRG